MNKKQNSISEIKKYNKNKASNSIINEISDITSEILVCNSIDRFNELIEAHELIISKLISKQTVKDHLFKDFDGYIKSLGAWGGDMIMVTSQIDPSKYFIEKGYSTIFKFKELLSNNIDFCYQLFLLLTLKPVVSMLRFFNFTITQRIRNCSHLLISSAVSFEISLTIYIPLLPRRRLDVSSTSKENEEPIIYGSLPAPTRIGSF